MNPRYTSSLLAEYPTTPDYLAEAQAAPATRSGDTGCPTTLDTWKIWLSDRPFINMNWTPGKFLSA